MPYAQPPARIGLFVLCAAVVLSGLVPAAAADSGAGEDPGLVRLRAYLGELNILRADFQQEVLDRDLELVEEASGQVVLKKPGRFRWDYRFPFEREIVADGERVWMYEVDLQQVTVHRLDASIGETPAALLTGDAQALDQFEFLGASSGEGIEWMRLRPLSSESDFERIGLGFDGDRLVQIMLDDRLGQQTRIIFTNIERPASVPDELFRFEAPAGVDVIGESDL